MFGPIFRWLHLCYQRVNMMDIFIVEMLYRQTSVAESHSYKTMQSFGSQISMR